jgi:hypothetical protein
MVEIIAFKLITAGLQILRSGYRSNDLSLFLFLIVPKDLQSCGINKLPIDQLILCENNSKKKDRI